MDRYSFEAISALVADEEARQRHEARDSLFLSAKLTVEGMPGEQVRVRNLSAGGLMAEYPAPIDSDTRVEIELRGIGAVGGRIAWATDGRIGVAFDQHIDPMLARKPVAVRPTPRR